MSTIVFFRDLERRIVETEMKITLAKSQGFHSNQLKSSSNKNFLAVIGIYTGFGYSLKNLEERGIVIRFIIGRSPNRGFSLDRNIEEENCTKKDFFKTFLQSSFLGNGDDYFNDMRGFKSLLKLLKDKQILMHSLIIYRKLSLDLCKSRIIRRYNTPVPEQHPDEWLFQFVAGVKAILLVPVTPHGVLQLGSLEHLPKDAKMSNYIKNEFFTHQDFMSYSDTFSTNQQFTSSFIMQSFNEFPSFMENNKSSDEVN
ncbi:unnamed protein product [Lactuca virosa]|uniref:Uncharacterized protein n=1 Tax=Lactuca virosa TaxID=75947 RepID=A0AAU9ML75_9ASTR|nr:unnamed protein product [Lactuca virosa]